MCITIGNKAVIIFVLARITEIKMGAVYAGINFYYIGSFECLDII